jgi:hypothetical protein
MSEPFSWSKFFGGLIDPTAYWKTFAIVIRVLLIALVIFAIYLAGVKIHSMLAPKSKQPSTFIVSDQVGGTVKNSSDQKETKFGLLNF